MKGNSLLAVAVAVMAGYLALNVSAAPASELLTTHRIPAALALEAVGEAVAVCAKAGYNETAVLVDVDGVRQALLRGDGTGPHSIDSASGKAYTSVTLKSNTTAVVNAYSLNTLQDRGVLFVDHGEACYEGQVVGEHCRPDDVAVNPTKPKQLTNMRTTSRDEAIILKPARKMTLEQALEYIEDDELVEVTPQNIRLRKTALTENDRKRSKKKVESMVEA